MNFIEFTNIILFLLCISPVFVMLYPNLKQIPIVISVFVSIISFFLSYHFIPIVNKMILSSRTRLYGFDLNKGEEGKKHKIPESLGIVSGSIYILSVCVILGIVIQIQGISSYILPDYFSGLFCSCFMLFLGFADDVLVLRWRYKIILPVFAMIPMLLCYSGTSLVLVPVPLRGMFFLGDHLDLGVVYKIYMGIVAVYCSNTINIYAGINGLESSQSVIISVFIIIHNLMEINGPYRDHHLFSLICMLPFLATTSSLMIYNWYPSSVFVGDSFTYFSGMTLATVGILGHFSKTLMIFFIPQWLNFLYSIPQLLHLVPIPRHRVPTFDEKTGKLRSSGNLTLINLFLSIFGPMNERTLTILLGAFQFLCCSIGLYVRYKAAGVYYPIEEFEKYV